MSCRFAFKIQRFKSGHSECRINAEDPDKNFMPSPGTLTSVHFPEV